MNDKKFNRLVEIARALNPIHPELRCSHFTFILKKGRILAIGQNSAKTNAKNLKYNYKSKDGSDLRDQVGTHSEMKSIIRFGREDCSNNIFVNIRLNKEGKLMNSKLCQGCFSLLSQVGYKRFYYSTDKQVFEQL